MPCARRARKSALAGAITTRSAQRASSMWPIAASAEARRILEEAEAQLREAVKAKPAPELLLRVQFRLALVLQRRGRLEEAAGLFQGLIASPLREQFSPGLLEWLVDHHLGCKEYGEAAEAATLVVARGESETWQQIGWCLSGKALLGLNRKEDKRQRAEKRQLIADTLKPLIRDVELLEGRISELEQDKEDLEKILIPRVKKSLPARVQKLFNGKILPVAVSNP